MPRESRRWCCWAIPCIRPAAQDRLRGKHLPGRPRLSADRPGRARRLRHARRAPPRAPPAQGATRALRRRGRRPLFQGAEERGHTAGPGPCARAGRDRALASRDDRSRAPFLRPAQPMTLACGDARSRRSAAQAELVPGILVLAQVFLGEGVDVRVGALLGHAFHPAADLEIAISVVGIHDGQCDRRAGRHVARLDPAFGRVHAQHAVGIVEPDRRHLGRAVRHQRRGVAKAFLSFTRSRNLSHRGSLPSSCSLWVPGVGSAILWRPRRWREGRLAGPGATVRVVPAQRQSQRWRSPHCSPRRPRRL